MGPHKLDFIKKILYFLIKSLISYFNLIITVMMINYNPQENKYKFIIRDVSPPKNKSLHWV